MTKAYLLSFSQTSSNRPNIVRYSNPASFQVLFTMRSWCWIPLGVSEQRIPKPVITTLSLQIGEISSNPETTHALNGPATYTRRSTKG